MTDERHQEAITLSEPELQAFAEKLDAWSRGLNAKEQAFLLEIIGRAASTGDVQAYGGQAHTEVARWNFENAWPSKVEWPGAASLIPAFRMVSG